MSSVGSSPASSRSSSSSSYDGSLSSSASSSAEPTAVLTRWIIDTRTLWPGDDIQASAAEYLSVISEEERTAILRKFHVADARMSLASAILKRAYINKLTGIKFADIQFSKRGDKLFGKPIWQVPEQSSARGWPQVDFNVSHQAGIATLVGISIQGGDASNEGEDQILIGCDIVAPNERPDLLTVQSSDFDDFTSTFSEIFSSDELFDMTYQLPSNSVTLLNGQRLSSETLGRLDRTIVSDRPLSVRLPDGRTEALSSDLIIDAKLRRFYTFFCLKEAYIKLVGEGLLAPWIKQCEFRNVQAPTPGTMARCSTHGVWGGKTSGGRSAIVSMYTKNQRIPDESEELEIWLHGEEVQDVRTDVQAFEEDFIIATMVKPNGFLPRNAEFPPWERLNLETDVLEVANISQHVDTAVIC